MIELPLSVLAWISVVVVQAVVHYMVLGSRRGQVQVGTEEEASALAEECLSLATAETSEESNDNASFSVLNSGFQNKIVLSSCPSSPLFIGDDNHGDSSEPESLLELLDQTGTELIKVRTNGASSFTFYLSLYFEDTLLTCAYRMPCFA